MERESFVFYASFLEGIEGLSNESQLKVYQAVMNFAIRGIEPTNLIGIEKSIFALIKPQILANNKKYKNGCSGGEFGKLGGRPKSKTKKTIKNPKGVIDKNPKGVNSKTPNENENENENVNENVNVNENDNDKQIEQPKQPVAVVPKKVPQQRVFDYFADKYKALTGFKYKSKSSDFVNLAKLIKDYGEDKVNQKIDWLEVGCVNRVFWFAKESGVNSFTIGNLVRNWNEILPQYTKEQLQEMEKKRQEEESMKRVLANVKKLKLERESWKNE
jgi:hypothetical protein